MKKVKQILNDIFIEGFTGMAIGIFPTLIIGLILTQIASFTGGRVGELLTIIGKIASSLTGAGIGIGIAVKFKSGFYMIGASRSGRSNWRFCISNISRKTFCRW